MDHILGVLDWLPQDEWLSSAMLAITKFGKDPEKSLMFFQDLERLAYGLLILPMGARGRRKRYNPIRRGLRDAASGKDPFAEVKLSAIEQKNILGVVSHNLHRSHSPAAKLVLMRLDLQSSGLPISHYNKTEQLETLSVEHMLPRNPKSNSKWMVDFPETRARRYNTEMVGNLFLVRDKSENESMKNFEFAIKHEILFNGKPEHPISLTNDLRKQKTWIKPDIEARQEKLLNIIDEIWSLGKTGT
jgi:hypothetical protein